jgi:hypothetical protein
MVTTRELKAESSYERIIYSCHIILNNSVLGAGKISVNCNYIYEPDTVTVSSPVEKHQNELGQVR